MQETVTNINLSASPNIKKSGISVIVCCYNSTKRLPETIKHLALQQVPGDIDWEVIIVDNASTDNTSKIALLEWLKYGRTDVPFKVVNQPIAGLRHARDKGIAESTFDYLVFCDDDNWLFENYVAEAYQGLNQCPDVAVIGGYGLEKPEIALPNWFGDYFTLYAVGSQNDKDGIITRDCPYVAGAGMVVRKSAYLALSNLKFDFKTTGRTEEELTSGEDVELCFALKLMGYNIAYKSALKYYHQIPESRLNAKYLAGMLYQFGCCDILHRPYYWLLTPGLAWYKKTWLWVLLVSLNLYVLSAINRLTAKGFRDDLTKRLSLINARARLITIVKLNRTINVHHRRLKSQFQIP